MSNQISMPILGTKENPILLSEITDISTLKDGTYIKFNCKDCEKEVIKQFKKGFKYYNLCRHCSFKAGQIEKYGSWEAYQKQRVEKQENTCIERFGYRNSFCKPEVQEKARISSKTEEVKNKIKESYNLEKRKEASKKGVKTKRKIYGEKLEKIMSKTFETQEEKYGKDFRKIFAEKGTQTKLEKYGNKSGNIDWLYTRNPMFNEETKKKVLEKALLNCGKYIYNNIHFDSGWELAYFIYLKDNNINFEYHPKISFKYLDNLGKERLYYPDFLVNGEFQEIKGNQFFNENNEPYSRYDNDFWWEKYNCMRENSVKILKYEDLAPIFEYIDFKYGKDYIKSFKS